MAGDYIKREDAINEICLRGCALERQRKLVLSMCEAKQFAVDVIDDIPAADVRENIYGKWIDMGDFVQCSACCCTRLKRYNCAYGPVTQVSFDNYCPTCGADMRGAKDE